MITHIPKTTINKSTSGDEEGGEDLGKVKDAYLEESEDQVLRPEPNHLARLYLGFFSTMGLAIIIPLSSFEALERMDLSAI